MLAAPGYVAPRSDEALTGGTAQGFQEETANKADSAGADADRKYESTLIARAALAGIVVQAMAGGEWLASRWSLSIRFASLGALEDWLCRIEGQHV